MILAVNYIIMFYLPYYKRIEAAELHRLKLNGVGIVHVMATRVEKWAAYMRSAQL